MRSKYCLPLKVKTISDALALAEQALQNTQHVELWVDYLESVDIGKLKKLIQKYPARIVLVFRRDKLDPPIMNEDTKRKILTAAARLNVLVDLDITTQQNDIAFYTAQDRHGTFIASFHDYSQTPKDLDEIIDTMTNFKPDLYKVATLCRTDNDAGRLIELKRQLEQKNIRSIVVGMGEKGRLARLVCDFWGNELVFAPTSDDKATAPGQFTRTELEEIDRILQ